MLGSVLGNVEHALSEQGLQTLLEKYYPGPLIRNSKIVQSVTGLQATHSDSYGYSRQVIVWESLLSPSPVTVPVTGIPVM